MLPSSDEEPSHNLRLIYFSRLVRNLRNRLNEKRLLLSNKLEEVQNIDTKRTNLMKQNFASAAHLEKTHTKYWNNYQQLIIEIAYIKEQILELEKAIQENLDIYHNIKNEFDRNVIEK